MNTKTKLYHARVCILVEIKEPCGASYKIPKVKREGVMAKNPTDAHRYIMEELWSKGCQIKKFLKLYTESK